jgi:hypothetical protein
MRMIAVAGFLIVLAAPLAAEAATASAQPICLRQDTVKDWKVLDDSTLIVTDRTDKKFRLSLMGACHDLQFQTALSFVTGGGPPCLARNDAILAPPPIGSAPLQRCLIAEIREYTAAMENADELAEGTLHHHPDTNGEIGAIP